MVQVNLLPWREEARNIKKIRFLTLLGLSVGLAIFFIAILHIYISSLISAQQDVNLFLKEQVTIEKTMVGKLKKQKEEKTAVLSQLRHGYTLQKQSLKAVEIVSMLASSVPDGVVLMKVTREGNKIILNGKTQSTLGVTAFMKNIEKTNQFNQPVLTKISDTENNQEKVNEDLFQIEVVQKGQ